MRHHIASLLRKAADHLSPDPSDPLVPAPPGCVWTSRKGPGQSGVELRTLQGRGLGCVVQTPTAIEWDSGWPVWEYGMPTLNRASQELVDRLRKVGKLP